MLDQTSRAPDANPARNTGNLAFRQPVADDGPQVWEIVAACPPLDRNSVYCNIVQCADFADTCVIAEMDAQAVGWVSGYRPPRDPSALFVWQVAVLPEARGLGLGKAMILALLDRPASRKVDRIKTTVTPDNDASWAMFRSVAKALNAPIKREPWLNAETHFQGRHDSEDLVTIGPIPGRGGSPEKPPSPSNQH